MTTQLVRIQLRRDTAADWTTANPVLLLGELGAETDTGKFKLGDGATAWNALPYASGQQGPPGPAGSGGQYTVTGSTGTPTPITAVGGVTIAGVQREFQILTGSGGPVVVTASPQIQVGTIIGQELLLTGCDDTDTVSLASGSGLVLNGACVLRNGSTLGLIWDGTLWREISRNDI